MTSASSTENIVRIGDDVYAFRFDFAALREMDQGRGHNCFSLAYDLSDGESRSFEVQQVLEVAINRVNDREIAITEAETESIKFIDRAGFQTAHLVAQKLLAYCLVGAEKKQSLQTLERVLQHLENATGQTDSRWPIFIGRLTLWGFRIGIFGIWAWLIFSPFGLHSLFKTG